MLANVKIKIPTFSTPTVTSAGALVLAANARRFYALIQNNSNTDMWLYFGAQGAVNQGILVQADGFSYEITRDNLWQGSIYAIHASGANKSLLVYEGH